jgi:hypothetical protein
MSKLQAQALRPGKAYEKKIAHIGRSRQNAHREKHPPRVVGAERAADFRALFSTDNLR